jgi:hypothetical protein
VRPGDPAASWSKPSVGCRWSAHVKGRVVADGCSSGAVAAPDASSERRVWWAVARAAAALTTTERAIGGAAAAAAVEAAAATTPTANTAWGAVATDPERACSRGAREAGGVRAGGATRGLTSALAPCCRVYSPEDCEPVAPPGKVATVAAGCPDRAAYPAAGAAGASTGNDDAVLETVTSAADVGRSPATGAGLSEAPVICVGCPAAGASAVPTADAQRRPLCFAALAPTLTRRVSPGATTNVEIAMAPGPGVPAVPSGPPAAPSASIRTLQTPVCTT